MNLIDFIICPRRRLLTTLPGFLHDLYFIDQPGVEIKELKALVKRQLNPYLESLRNDLYVLIEGPYIDKMYRDAYYHFYSSKLTSYDRNSVRLSFFDKEITENDFRDFEDEDKNPLQPHYLGFMILRPTFSKMVGRTVISPAALIDNGFDCCQAKITSTANAVKFTVRGFPYSSQDSQTITCAETTIWALMEYFGNKFPDYKPVMPSAIHQVLKRIKTRRVLPSDGLSGPEIAYILNEFGFGTMPYSCTPKKEKEFQAAISTYVQSGIPVIGVYQTPDRYLGHAVNIIGHEKDDLSKLGKTKEIINLDNGGKLIDYHMQPRKFVVVDDNYPPYQLAEFSGKNVKYKGKDTGYELTDIIVPLYSKIYQDVNRIRQNILRILMAPQVGVRPKDKLVMKLFLASTRSYKQYLAINRTINPVLKEILIQLPMPRFVWVAELCTTEAFKKGMVSGLVLVDPTEPVKYEESNGELEGLAIFSPLTAVYNNGMLFCRDLMNFEKIRIFAAQKALEFTAYKENLRPGY